MDDAFCIVVQVGGKVSPNFVGCLRHLCRRDKHVLIDEVNDHSVCFVDVENRLQGASFALHLENKAITLEELWLEVVFFFLLVE